MLKSVMKALTEKNCYVFLQKHIKNNKLIRLIHKLIYSFEKGLSIGSYLSQYLCNLYLSELYHEISERMYRIRHTKSGSKKIVNLVDHTLFYMDDILIVGSNKKDIHKAVKLIMQKAKSMGLEIKNNRKVFLLKDNHSFIDMMGFRIYRNKVTIRRRVFKRVRRAYIRANRFNQYNLCISLARKIMSYKGYIDWTDSNYFVRNYNVRRVNKLCRKVVSDYESSVFRKTTESVV